MSHEECSWCGARIEPDEGFRAFEPVGERRAVFCRLEHIAPWVIEGAYWSPGEVDVGELRDGLPQGCSHCGAPLGEMRVLLVRHWGEQRIADGFCGLDHLVAWAKAGGRWD